MGGPGDSRGRGHRPREGGVHPFFGRRKEGPVGCRHSVCGEALPRGCPASPGHPSPSPPPQSTCLAGPGRPGDGRGTLSLRTPSFPPPLKSVLCPALSPGRAGSPECLRPGSRGPPGGRPPRRGTPFTPAARSSPRSRRGGGALPGGPGHAALCSLRPHTMARSLTWRCCPWCLTEDEKTAARIDQEINKILLEQKKRDRGELKLLLLGEPRAQLGGQREEGWRRGSRPHQPVQPGNPFAGWEN